MISFRYAKYFLFLVDFPYVFAQYLTSPEFWKDENLRTIAANGNRGLGRDESASTGSRQHVQMAR